MVAGNSPEWLPPGFNERIKVKDGRKIKVYTDTSTGNKFYSKPAVIRHLGTVNQNDVATKEIKLEVEDESSSKTEISPQSQLEVEDEPSSKSEISPQRMPIASSGCNSEKKNKGKHSFNMVACESESADGIPPGWIVETRTSKSGNKIRNDRFYIDPNSCYIFSSKKDVIRYLENRDISSCATRPKKLETDDLQFIKNEIHSSSRYNKFSGNVETEQHLAPGESDSGVESSCAKTPEAPDAKISEPTQDNSAHSLEENESCENSNKVAEMKYVPEPTCENESRENSIKDAELKIDAELTEVMKVTDQVLPKRDSEIHQKLRSSGIEKQADDVPVNSTKSKKRKGLILPSRASKRLAGCKPEIQSDMMPSKQAFGVAAMRTPSSDVKTSWSSSVEAVAYNPSSCGDAPAKDVATLPIVVNETPVKIEPLKNVEKPQKEAIQVEKQADHSTRSQESQLCFGFGNSWPDPCLEFAFKTLTEEIPYEETLAYSGRLSHRSSIPSNQSNEFSKRSDSDVTGVFQSVIPAHPKPLKNTGSLDLSHDKSISFQACSGVSSQQSSSEARNMGCQNLPASETAKQTAKASVSLRKSKKREDLSLPSQTSEKLFWSGIATTLKFVGEKTLQQVEPSNKVDKPHLLNQAIPDHKPKQKDSARSEESELCNEFGSSWSDPCLDFAFKTLTGEIPIAETFALSGRFGNQSGVPYNQAKDPIKPSGSVVSTIFQTEIPCHSMQLKKNNVVHLLPGTNTSFPSYGGLSSQRSNLEARNMEYQTKFSLRK
ncbi:hypothetical protein F511_14285 [Dorcoceras hygrometricum]|uniref:MBD domain-containing protein n=1 Tax=Dorcoceras hygrometricum TaxID=472368 RepID=A0A2Z7BVI4_9LAMI|nr:hypothetical protein F511_14285 [Dorcoceras hygrometricum]